MSKQLAATVAALFKRKGQACVIAWGVDGDGKGKGKATPQLTTVQSRCVVMVRKNSQTGVSTTEILLLPTARSVIGAKLTTGGRTYVIKDATEHRPTDVFVYQELVVA